MRRFAPTLFVGLLVLAGCDDTVQFPEVRRSTSDAELRQNLSNWGVIPIGPPGMFVPEPCSP